MSIYMDIIYLKHEAKIKTAKNHFRSTNQFVWKNVYYRILGLIQVMRISQIYEHVIRATRTKQTQFENKTITMSFHVV